MRLSITLRDSKPVTHVLHDAHMDDGGRFALMLMMTASFPALPPQYNGKAFRRRPWRDAVEQISSKMSTSMRERILEYMCLGKVIVAGLLCGFHKATRRHWVCALSCRLSKMHLL